MQKSLCAFVCQKSEVYEGNKLLAYMNSSIRAIAVIPGHEQLEEEQNERKRCDSKVEHLPSTRRLILSIAGRRIQWEHRSDRVGQLVRESDLGVPDLTLHCRLHHHHHHRHFLHPHHRHHHLSISIITIITITIVGRLALKHCRFNILCSSDGR